MGDLIRPEAPIWTMGMPGKPMFEASGASKNPGPGTYKAVDDAYLKCPPKWTMMGPAVDPPGKDEGPGIGAYNIATKPNTPQWSMLARPTGKPKVLPPRKEPGPGSYKLPVTTNFDHP